MTYKQLIEQIVLMPKERQEDDVTIHDVNCDEYFKVHGKLCNEDTDGILDEGHYYLTISSIEDADY